MTVIPIAAFLAGSLLTLLLPIGLLIAIAVWYVRLARRLPDPAPQPGLDAAPSRTPDEAAHAAVAAPSSEGGKPENA